MSISTDYIPQSNTLLISISGSLEGELSDALKEAYEKTDTHPTIYLLDLRLVNYLDSSALKLLLDFCHYAEQHMASIIVMNMNEEVLQSFRLLNLHKLFKPEYHRAHYRVDWVFHGEHY